MYLFDRQVTNTPPEALEDHIDEEVVPTKPEAKSIVRMKGMIGQVRKAVRTQNSFQMYLSLLQN